MRAFLIFLTLMILGNAQVFAAVSPVAWGSPYPIVFGTGGLRILRSDTTTTCDAAAAGAIRYNAGNFQWCNGTSWSTFGASGAGTALSSITAATATNTINNVNFAQTWNWNSLAGETALKLASSSVGGGTLLAVSTGSSNSQGNLLLIESTDGNSSFATNLAITNASTSLSPNIAKALTINMSGTTGDSKGIDISMNANGGSGAGVKVTMASGTAAAPAFHGVVDSANEAAYVLDAESTRSNVIRIKNSSTASNGNGGRLLYSANRTTGGMTAVASVGGIITDITNGAYKGALVFYTANNAAPTEHVRIDTYGHIIYTGTAPSITANCGTSPSVAGTDVAGRITVGTGGSDTSCTLTFANAWTTAPACTVGDESTSLLLKGIATTTTLIISAATPFGASDKIVYNCYGY